MIHASKNPHQNGSKKIYQDFIACRNFDSPLFCSLANCDGSTFTDNTEQEIYASIYKFEHTGLIPGYQTIAKYHKDIDAVVIQFTNTVDFNGYNWNLSEVMYSRIIKILKKKG